MFLARSFACVSQNLMVVIQVMLHLPLVSSLQAIFDSKHLLGSRPPGEAAPASIPQKHLVLLARLRNLVNHRRMHLKA
jgi:hypothetical protein